MGYEFLDRSVDSTGTLGDGVTSYAANEEGYEGPGWNNPAVPRFPLPGGGGTTAGGGPSGLKSTPQPHLGDDPDPDPPPPSEDPEAQAQAFNQLILNYDLYFDEEGHFQGGAFHSDLNSILEWDNPRWRQPPCQTYDVPWERVDEDCFPRRGLFGWGGQHDSASIEELCDAPCIELKEIPDLEAANNISEDLDIEVESGTDDAQDWVDIVECAWALLEANLDLIDFIMCTLTGNPNSGDCIRSKILEAPRPRIIISGELADLEKWFGNDITASALPTNATLAAWVASLILHVPLPLVEWKITLYTPNHRTARALDAWNTPGEETCACLYMAGLLLHELSHTCARNLNDFLPEGPCSLSEMLQNSFYWMASQRYAPLGSCCEHFDDDNKWWNGEGVELRCPGATGATRGTTIGGYGGDPFSPERGGPILPERYFTTLEVAEALGFSDAEIPDGPERIRGGMGGSEVVVLLDGAKISGPW